MKKNDLFWMVMLLLSSTLILYFTFSDKFDNKFNLITKNIDYFKYECKVNRKRHSVYLHHASGFAYTPLVGLSCEELDSIIEKSSKVKVLLTDEGQVVQIFADEIEVLDEQLIEREVRGIRVSLIVFGLIIFLLSSIKLLQSYRRFKA